MADPAKPRGDGSMTGRWCILRTSAARTLKLAASLSAAGFEVWTPTLSTVRPGPRRGRLVEREVIERDAPIVPTFVFARAADVSALAAASVAVVTPHPPFSLFRHAGRIPLIGGASLATLQATEREGQEAAAARREVAKREVDRQERAALLRTEKARRKALRAERKALAPGTQVTVQRTEFAGMTGEVVSCNGRDAIVSFGGAMQWTIEAWLLSADDVA